MTIPSPATMAAKRPPIAIQAPETKASADERTCPRDGCKRRIKHPEQFEHCSAICKELSRLLDNVKLGYTERGLQDEGALWAKAVAAADQVTAVVTASQREWMRHRKVVAAALP